MKTLDSPEYTDEEREKIVNYLLALKKPQIQAFLEANDLPKSGTKHSLRERVEEALDDGTLTYSAIVECLDVVAPWGKQHVYLYTGPTTPIENWKNPTWLTNHLKQHKVGKYLNAHLPLILPSALKLSSIQHDVNRLRVTAVERRDWWERNPEYDQQAKTDEGEQVALRAFIHHVDRGLIAFEWNLVANTAFLQITQLHGDSRYEDARERFSVMVQKWLDITRFTPVNICPAIKRLHELEEAGTPEARSHGIDYSTLQGRRLSARSASSRDSVLGEPVIDNAMSNVRQQGVGRNGNFYWLSSHNPGHGGNPLTDEVHVVVVGNKGRINFPTPNTEEVVRHVLTRIRAHSA
jgi:hypothetical protein